MGWLKERGFNDTQKVIKRDPYQLVVFQYYVLTERAEEYKKKISSPSTHADLESFFRQRT